MKTCPKCAYQNLDNTTTCVMCGTPLPDVTTILNNGTTQENPYLTKDTLNPYGNTPEPTPTTPQQNAYYQNTTLYTQPMGQPMYTPPPVVPVNPYYNQAPPAPPQQYRKPPKKNMVATLSILFGSFGLQKFLVGRPASGVVMILFFWTFIPTFIGLMEGIRMFALSTEDYNITYRIPVKKPTYPTTPTMSY